MRSKENNNLISTELIKDSMHRQIAAPHLIDKFKIISIKDVGCLFRKSIVILLPDTMHM